MKKLFFILTIAFITLQLSAQKEESWKPSVESVEMNSQKYKPLNLNFYESKVHAYTLPDPLLTQDGKVVKTIRDWEETRRHEILELFRENVYGRVPDTPYKKTFQVVNEDKNAMGGSATLRQVDITISVDSQSLVIHLNIFVPNKIQKPVPLFLLINNRGVENTDPMREVKSEFWPAEEVIARGYGIAAFKNDDVDPDNYDGFKNGIHGILDRGKRDDESWGTLAAWAWGASRCMDYFETDKDIDKNKIAVVGHSRGGKTALWAGAEDPRFAMVISNDSGEGGASLARRSYGETVARLNVVFPHWFCSNYNKFSDNVTALPIDQHMLIALIAPRAVYVDSADEDLWADPKGSYLSLYYAVPVYKLFYTETTLPKAMPPLNKQVVSGKIGYHIRDGSHNMLLKDWNWFMDFADKTFNQ